MLSFILFKRKKKRAMFFCNMCIGGDCLRNIPLITQITLPVGRGECTMRASIHIQKSYSKKVAFIIINKIFAHVVLPHTFFYVRCVVSIKSTDAFFWTVSQKAQCKQSFVQCNLCSA